MQGNEYKRDLSARQSARVADLAERLYDHMPPVCWMTEENLAKELGVSRWQIRNAKAHLLNTGRVKMELRQNGKRSNAVHTLIKSAPINQCVDDDGSVRQMYLNVIEGTSANDVNRMSTLELLEFYEEIRFQTIPLHYPKFKPGLVYCSCKRGRYCPRIGKHPVVAYKSLDFSDRRTYRAMRSYWRHDINYNIGFRVDGFIVLDVDYRHGGQWSLASLQDELGELPDALTVTTGNGRHIYVTTNADIPNAVGIMGQPGLDVRSSGGIVVAPCSVHASENQYQWETFGAPERLPESWTLNLQAGGTSSARNPQAGRQTAQPEVLLPSTPDANFVIPDGRRNRTLFGYACRERGKGASRDHILDVITTLNETYCEPKLEASELRDIAASAMRYPSEAEKRQTGVR